MKYRIMIMTLAAGLFIAGSASARERGPGMDRQHRVGPQELGLQAIQHLGKAIRRLDLSEEQKVAIHDEFGVFRDSVKPLVREFHGGRKALKDVITAENYNADAAAEIAEQQGQLTTEITLLVSESVAAVLSHLDEAQRAELQAMGEDRRARRDEHRDIAKARMRERKEARRKEPPEGN